MVLKKYAYLLLDELSGRIAKNHVAELSKFHRLQATPYFYDAAIYVKKELEKIGLDKVVIEQFPADGKTKAWTQTTRLSWRINDGELWMVEPRREVLARFKETPSRVIGHSKKTDTVTEVVDVGEGTDKEYQGKNIEGKIALIGTDRERERYKKAMELGAVGVIIYPPFNRSAGYPDMIRTSSFYTSIEEVEQGKAPFGFNISARQAETIKSIMKEGRAVKVHAKIDAELYNDTLDVLTGQITGSEKPDEEVVLIAHLCHYVNCSNDNASGSATILEVARSIKSLMNSGRIERPKRTIRFFWVPEIIGTYFWMHRYIDKVRNQIAVINLDMVGEHPVYCGYPLNLIRVPDSVPNYLNDLLPCLLEYVADHPKGVEPLEGWKPGMNYRVEKHCGGSDHICFTDSYFGIPAIMFYNPDQFHHMSLDTLDKVDSSKLQRVGVVTGAAALTIANADELTSIALAALTRGGGYTRIGEAASEVVEELASINSTASENLSLKLGTAYVRGLKKIEIVAKRETSNVLSVQRLSVSPMIGILSEGFSEFAEGEKARVRALYKVLRTNLRLDPIEEERDSEVLETMKLVPKKEFEGPVPSMQIDKLKKEDREWLAEFGRTHNPHRNFTLALGGPSLEFMNFVDGKRSLYEIAMRVNVEYGNITPSEAKRFFDVNRELGFISYTRRT